MADISKLNLTGSDLDIKDSVARQKLTVVDPVEGEGLITFAVDSNGNYGYKKVGADTVTPFSNGGARDVKRQMLSVASIYAFNSQLNFLSISFDLCKIEVTYNTQTNGYVNLTIRTRDFIPSENETFPGTYSNIVHNAKTLVSTANNLIQQYLPSDSLFDIELDETLAVRTSFGAYISVKNEITANVVGSSSGDNCSILTLPQKYITRWAYQNNVFSDTKALITGQTAGNYNGQILFY